MPQKRIPWYRMKGLRHVTGFLTPKKKAQLRKLARAADMTLVRYVTRLLEKHVEAAGPGRVRKAVQIIPPTDANVADGN